MNGDRSAAGAPRGPGAAIRLTVIGWVVGALLVGGLGARLLQRQNPLARSWRAAQAAGGYRFSGQTRWEAGADRAVHRVEGQGWPDGRLELTVTTSAASAPLRLSVHWPQLEVGDAAPGTAEMDPHALARLLPAGDPLLLLAAGQGASGGDVQDPDGGDCRVWVFRVGGRAYQGRWRDMPRFLPVNADSGGMPTFQAVGRLWQDPISRLPCRLAAELELPRVAGEQTGRAWVDWTYTWPAARARPSP